MIVPSMDYAEIRSELKKDFPIVFRKANYVSIETKRNIKLKRDEEQIICYEYYSKYKNNWIYKIIYTKKHSYLSFLHYNYDAQGLNAIIVTDNMDDYLYVFTAHFFKRYNERRKLGLVNPKDIIAAFFTDISNLHIEDVEELENGFKKIFCPTKYGVILGLDDEKNKIFRMNTFVNNELLRKEQKELLEDLKKEFELEIDVFKAVPIPK